MYHDYVDSGTIWLREFSVHPGNFPISCYIIYRDIIHTSITYRYIYMSMNYYKDL